MGCNLKSFLSAREPFIKLKGNYIHCIFQTFVFYRISLKIITTCLQRNYILKNPMPMGNKGCHIHTHTHINVCIYMHLCIYIITFIVSVLLQMGINYLQTGLAYPHILLIQSHAFIYNPPRGGCFLVLTVVITFFSLSYPTQSMSYCGSDCWVGWSQVHHQ